MKTFVINMKKDSHRRKSMTDQFNKLNLEYEFIDAINGKELSNDELNIKCDYDYFKNRSGTTTRFKGIIGAALSHANVYKKIIDNKLSGALILEDDMILNSDFHNILNSFDNQNTKIDSREIVLFYTQSLNEKAKLSKINSREVEGIYRLYYPVNYKNIWSACAYYISFESAKIFLQTYPKVSRVADDWHAFYEKGIMSTYSCVYPFPVEHGYFESSIGENVENKSKLKKVLKNISPVLLSMLLQINRKIYSYLKAGTTLSNKVSPIDISANQ